MYIVHSPLRQWKENKEKPDFMKLHTHQPRSIERNLTGGKNIDNINKSNLQHALNIPNANNDEDGVDEIPMYQTTKR